METILDAADRYIPKTSCRESKIRVPWWTDECERVTTERRGALRRLQRTGSDVDRASYRRWRAIARFVQNQSNRILEEICVWSELKFPNVESTVQDAEDDRQIQSTKSTQNKPQQ